MIQWFGDRYNPSRLRQRFGHVLGHMTRDDGDYRIWAVPQGFTGHPPSGYIIAEMQIGQDVIERRGVAQQILCFFGAFCLDQFSIPQQTTGMGQVLHIILYKQNAAGRLHNLGAIRGLP